VRRLLDDLGQALAALEIGAGADILLAVEQEVVGADEGRILLLHLRRHGLAVEALLQVGEGAGRAVGAGGAADQQLAVDDAVEADGIDDIGKGGRDVVAGARIDLAGIAGARQLHADAVPFPLGGVIGRIEPCQIALLDRIGEHDGMEDRRRRQRRLAAPALQPGKQALVGRLQPVPECLDLGHVRAAELGQRLLGETGRDADAQRAGRELDEGEAAGGVEAVEQIADVSAHLGAAERVHLGDHLAEPRLGKAERSMSRSLSQTSEMVSARSPT
jgi:hypothetical protein